MPNLDDAAAEWLLAPATTETLLENFAELYPDIMHHLPDLRFLEQYDPDDISPGAATQPYAYVAGTVEQVTLALDLDDIQERVIGHEQQSALAMLRDKVAPEAKVAWYVVVCGDEERWVPPTPEGENDDTSHGNQTTQTNASVKADEGRPGSQAKAAEPSSLRASEPRSKGLGKMLSSYTSKLGRKK